MSETVLYADRLIALRKKLTEAEVQAFVLPVTDEFQGEYSADYARRVTWLTGFDGSAGSVAVTQMKAALFVDGRYTLQAAQEVDAALYEIHNSGELSPAKWLASALKEEDAVGYDPMLYTPIQLEQMEEVLTEAGITLLPMQPNPVDVIWQSQPAMPSAPVEIHSLEYAGITHQEKRQQMAQKLQKKGIDVFLLTQPEALCWLLNIRGADIPFNPLPLCYGLLHADARVELFIDPAKIDANVREHLGRDVDIHPLAELDRVLKGLAVSIVGFDAKWSPSHFFEVLEAAGAEVVLADNPIIPAKAIKNQTEIEGIRHAHVLDGAAVTRFLCWFDTLDGEVDELAVADRLEQFREMQPEYREPSFATIAGSAGNGAIVHYRANEKTSRKIAPGEVLLLDSGGQYPFGTTDITRTTIRSGQGAGATEEFKDRFTRVLKGHIALAQAQFPEGTSGTQLDILARQPLWDAGLDYDHGTGHGVGCYLCVHEGPQRISKRGGDVPLAAGMILSNEPGYYKTGEYGIRTENLVLVVERETVGGKRFLGVNTLTLAPIDTRQVLAKLLTDSERAWLNHYHTRVREGLASYLSSFELEWLAEYSRAV